MQAAEKGHAEVAKELVGAGADVSVKDREGKTALMRVRNNVELVKLLRKAASKE